MRITMVGEFVEHWGGESNEIDAMDPEVDNGLGWSPSVKDFTAVANATVGKGVVVVANLGGFLGAIQAARSIDRIDLITHAMPRMIGLHGDVDRKGDAQLYGDENSFDARPNRSITLGGLNWLNTTPGGRDVRDDLRKRFTPTARIVIYACNGGIAQGLAMLMELAKTFNVATSGFADEIEYDAVFDRKLRVFISRNRTRYEPMPTERRTQPFHAGFGHLMPDMNQPKPPVPSK